MAVLIDVTDRKQVERRLIQAQKMEMVGQLTGGLAHDFNNLLAVVLGNLQLMRRSLGDDDRLSKRVTSAISAVDRGAGLTRRLLAFSRRHALETVEVNPLIEDLSDLLRQTLGETIELDCRLADGIRSVDTDRTQLETALINLAVNSRDAMPDGGKLTIESSAVRIDPAAEDAPADVADGDYVVLTVTDTGRGIAPENLDRVFEPFFTTKDVGRGSGLGLGLSMVYGFMKQSGGHIRVASEVGTGTRVSLYLPTKAGEGVDAAPAGASEIGGEAPEARSAFGTVLVVEDQSDVREIAIDLLNDIGFRTIEAADAEAALRVLSSDRRLDLLFTDIVMPGSIRGTELTYVARQLRPGLPVVFTTGYADVGLLRDSEVPTAGALVTKPYGRDDLAEKPCAAIEQAAAS